MGINSSNFRFWLFPCISPMIADRFQFRPSNVRQNFEKCKIKACYLDVWLKCLLKPVVLRVLGF